MKISRLTNTLATVCLIAVAALSQTSCSDVWSEQHPGTYYITTGQTVADFLQEDPDGRFTDFIAILKKAQTWGELETYGDYTCFAPTNEAVQDFLEEKRVQRQLDSMTVDMLTKSDCDTVAWNHLLKTTCFMTDCSEGRLPQVNMLNRFLVVGYVADTLSDGTIKPVVTINRDTRIIHEDDTVENGVVQVVDHVIRVAGDFVFDVVKENTNATLFSTALNMIGFEDSLKKWHDYTYRTPSYDSTDIGIVRDGGGSQYTIYYLSQKNYGFTLLVEPDQVYAAAGINNIEDLINHANSVMHESYASEYAKYGDKYDTLWTDRRNPLNRFISYHILPFSMPSVFNYTPRKDIIDAKCLLTALDPEDYYETYLPHSLIRVSRIMSGSDAGVYINRRGVGSEEDGVGEFGRPFYRGIKVSDVADGQNNEGCNGYIQYLDGVLDYSDYIRTDILNRRMRVDCCTLSPDFMTSGARQNEAAGGTGIGFVEPTNFHSFNTDYTMWVRTAVVANISYQGDGLDLQGNYDIMLKLPPIPYDGTWQLRLSYRGSSGCGVVQNYVGDDPDALKPCGIPTDLRYSAVDNPNIRWKADDDFEGDTVAIDAYDKAMKNRGYMKGPDSHYTSNKDQLFRNYSLIARRIITTDYFYADRDYYLRMKLVLDNSKAEMNFDYMEWCPKNIFDFNENKH